MNAGEKNYPERQYVDSQRPDVPIYLQTIGARLEVQVLPPGRYLLVCVDEYTSMPPPVGRFLWFRVTPPTQGAWIQ
jgi:hypothetical protein